MTDETRMDGVLLSSVFYEYYRKGLVCEANGQKMSAGEYAVLQLLINEPEHCLLIGELTEKLHTTQPAVSQIVKRMEKKELIRKEASSGDRRNVHVHPSERGEELYRFFHENSLSFTERVIAKMEPGNGAKLLALLEEFLKHAEEETEA